MEVTVPSAHLNVVALLRLPLDYSYNKKTVFVFVTEQCFKHYFKSILNMTITFAIQGKDLRPVLVIQSAFAYVGSQ